MACDGILEIGKITEAIKAPAIATTKIQEIRVFWGMIFRSACDGLLLSRNLILEIGEITQSLKAHVKPVIEVGKVS